MTPHSGKRLWLLTLEQVNKPPNMYFINIQSNPQKSSRKSLLIEIIYAE